MSSLDYLDLCRLCLVKDRVSVPIFDGEGDVRQIFLKIAACLPVKVAREDKLPKKICGDCVYKVELLYQFWNTTANAEKQLLQWLGEVGLEDKQGYVTGVLNPSIMKQEDSSPVGLAGGTIQVSGTQPNIGIGVIDNMGLGMPLIIPGGNDQQLTSVSMETNVGTIQPVHQAVPGPSNPSGTDPLSQSQTNTSTRHQEDEEETSEEEENSDDDCDGDDGLPVKEESEEDPSNSRTIEPTTFVNVSLACDEAGPSGLQQQKIAEIPELSMPQNVDGDAKSGSRRRDGRRPGVVRRKMRKLDAASKVEVEDAPEFSAVIKTEPDAAAAKETGNNVGKNGRVLVIVDSIRDEGNAEVPPIKFRDEDPLRVDAAWDFVKIKIPAAVTPVKKEWKCKDCQKICGSRELLRKHRVVHSEEFKYSCNVCEKKFKRSSELKVHGKSHSNEKNFICDICASSFKLKSQLTIHTKRHADSYEIICELCQKGFHTRGDYKSHQFTKHGVSGHVCPTCGKAFRSKTILGKHSRIHRPDYTPDRPHQCETCGKMFATKKSLKIHGNTHTGERSYSCDTCGKTVRTRASLRDHIRLHTGQKPVVCRYCKKGFTKRSTMTVHMRIHTGERPHKCDTCQKTFTQRTSLVIHRRYHTGERPYQCPNCSKGFVSSAQLKLHKNSSC